MLVSIHGTGMTLFHLTFENGFIRTRQIHRTYSLDKFRGFPITHTIIRKTRFHEHARIALRFDIVHRAVGPDVLVRLVLVRVAPFVPFGADERDGGVGHGDHRIHEWHLKDGVQGVEGGEGGLRGGVEKMCRGGILMGGVDWVGSNGELMLQVAWNERVHLHQHTGP